MTDLYNRIKQDRLAFRKAGQKDSALTLTTLVGELETMEKRGDIIDDATVVSKIRKTTGNLQDMINFKGGDRADEQELALLESYLPNDQLSEDEIERIVAEIGAENIGQAMKHLIQNYPGQYDGGVARKVIMGVLK